MDSNITYYIALLALIVVGVVAVKQIAGCMLKSIAVVVLLAVGAAIYWLWLR